MARMTKEQVVRLRAQIEEVLEDLGASIGYKIKLKRGTYNEVLVFKLEVAPIPLDGTEVSEETQKFNQMCYHWGIKKEALNTKVSIKGVIYTIKGARPNAKKYPLLLVRDSDGAKFRYSYRTVRDVLPSSLKTMYGATT